MPITRLEYLFQRYLNRGATAGENQELMQLLQQSAHDAAIKTILNDVWQHVTVERQLSPEKADAMFQTILSSNPANPIPVMAMDARRPRLLPLKRWAVAAAVLVLVATGGWLFYINRSTPPVATTNATLTNDIAPGKNNAVLILADGRRINLDSAVNGNVAREGSTMITKKEGLVQYDASNSPLTIDHSPSYNTVATARGNQYKLILPDGSAVWLNAESSVRFPVAFTGNERRIEVTGEVYLAVQHNNKMPFTVVANGVEVRDLGTEFNVDAYEGLVTTVVEGSVVVKRQTANGKGQSAVLVRGQQGSLTNGSRGVQVVKNADVEAAIAWKNGQFMFTGNSIQQVMKQLERWYDVEVTYGPNVSKEEFVGTMTRFANISSVLKMLEKTGTVHFEVHGRKVLVK